MQILRVAAAIGHGPVMHLEKVWPKQRLSIKWSKRVVVPAEQLLKKLLAKRAAEGEAISLSGVGA